MKRLALIVALLVPAAAIAGPGRPAAGAPDPELHKLREEIAAAKLDRNLNLTRDQAKALLPILKEAAEQKARIQADHDKRRPEIVRALTAVRDDLLKTGVVSEASRKALVEARGDAAFKETREKMRELHHKAKELLTADQKTRLHEFDPRPLDGEGDEHGFGGAGEEQHGRKHHEGKGGHEGKGEGKGGMHKVLKVATTPEFLALVEARAR